MHEKDMVPYLHSKGWIAHPKDPSYWQSPRGRKHLMYKTTTAYGSQRRHEQRQAVEKDG